MVHAKHISHCFVFLALFLFVNFILSNWNWNLTRSYGNHLNIFIITLSIIGIFGRLYVVLHNLAGIIFFDCFPNKVTLRSDFKALPKISFRIVTKGNYPDLVKRNVENIKKTCAKVALKNYIIEVLTEKVIRDLKECDLVKIILVPQSYQTKNGMLFKGRNLQYCLEKGVSCLENQDWIVHFDEDNTLTTDAINGIANFINDGQHLIGQGGIRLDLTNNYSYAIKHLMTLRTFMDRGCSRVGFTIGLPNGMKGSYIVCNVEAEKRVEFNGNPWSSVVEFCYFSNRAYEKGYTLGWVEGEILEIGTPNVKEFIKQHTRLFTGFRYLLYDTSASAYSRICFATFTFSFYTYPFYLLSLCINLFFVGDFIPFVFLYAIIITHDIYLGVYCLYRYPYDSVLKNTIMFIGNLFWGPFYSVAVISVAVWKCWFRNGIEFRVTKKEFM